MGGAGSGGGGGEGGSVEILGISDRPPNSLPSPSCPSIAVCLSAMPFLFFASCVVARQFASIAPRQRDAENDEKKTLKVVEALQC